MNDGKKDTEGVSLAAANAEELEGNYTIDDQMEMKDEDGHDSTVNLASRTDVLMKNFSEYLADVTKDVTPGDGDPGRPRQRSLKLNGDDAMNGGNNTVPTPYRDFIDIEENHLDNLASYEDIERELQMQGRYPKRKTNSKSWFNSKRVKRGLCTIAVAAIVIGVSVGVTTSRKKNRLPDWNQQLTDQIAKEGITGDGRPGPKPQNWKPGDPLPPTGGSHVGGEIGYENGYNKYPNTNTQSIPVAHNTTTGNHSSGPYGNHVQVLNKPNQGNAHNILDGFLHNSSSASGSSQQVSSVTAENSVVDRNPNIPSDGGSDQQQQQQQQQQSSSYFNTEQTYVTPNVVAEEYLAAQEWNPKWYTRSDGWLGQTYEQASTFCKSLGDSSDLCSYAVICPTGPNHLPYGGKIEEPSGSWAPIKDSNNGWVQVGDNNVCIRYMTLYLTTPEWGITGQDNEEITRHLPCCTPPSVQADVLTISEDASNTAAASNTATSNTAASSIAAAIDAVESKFKPVKYDREKGWGGSTYADAIIFCASQQSKIPCPYEAYCPSGEFSSPYGGVSDNPNGSWAPMMDAPNSWVQIGKVGTCQKYNDLHPHPPLWGLTGENSEALTSILLCCDEYDEHVSSPMSSLLPLTEKEMTVVNNMHPVWFSRSHGYHGTTHEEADLFCGAIIGMHLCPIEAYCPNGNTSEHKPLYLQKDAFQGEQWAPFSPFADTQTDLGDGFVMIGTLDGNPSSTCLIYDSIHPNQLPPWSADGSRTDLKQYVMCCETKVSIEQEAAIKTEVFPIWLDAKHGWSGGSHEDAENFCNQLGGKKLCPYAAYCPNGIGKQPIGGHSADFNAQGVQYAPVHGESNAWVMIGQKDGNAATTCMMYTQLEGDEPEWGLNDERQEIKNHILCCSL